MGVIADSSRFTEHRPVASDAVLARMMIALTRSPDLVKHAGECNYLDLMGSDGSASPEIFFRDGVWYQTSQSRSDVRSEMEAARRLAEPTHGSAVPRADVRSFHAGGERLATPANEGVREMPSVRAADLRLRSETPGGKRPLGDKLAGVLRGRSISLKRNSSQLTKSLRRAASRDAVAAPVMSREAITAPPERSAAEQPSVSDVPELPHAPLGAKIARNKSLRIAPPKRKPVPGNEPDLVAAPALGVASPYGSGGPTCVAGAHDGDQSTVMLGAALSSDDASPTDEITPCQPQSQHPTNAPPRPPRSALRPRMRRAQVTPDAPCSPADDGKASPVPTLCNTNSDPESSDDEGAMAVIGSLAMHASPAVPQLPPPVQTQLYGLAIGVPKSNEHARPFLHDGDNTTMTLF